MCEQREHAICVSSVYCRPFTYSIYDAPVSSEFQESLRRELSETPPEYKSRVLRLQLSTGDLTAPKGEASLLNQDILQVQKVLSVILSKVNDQRTFLSSLYYFPVLANH